MTRLPTIAVLAAITGLASLTGAGAEPLACVGATVASHAEVVDARSLRLADGRNLRLAGIEPFDILLADSDDAEARLQGRVGELLRGGALSFQVVAQQADRYGRLPAMLWAGKNLVQEVAAREGLAIAFAIGATLPCFDRILAAENSARRANRGFWKDQRLPNAFPPALASRIGRFTIFEGRVLSVGNRATRSFLNFGRRWTEDVTVEIAAKDRDAFGGEPKLAEFAGHRVRVRGFLEEKGGPMLIVSSPMQIEMLDQANETQPRAP